MMVRSAAVNESGAAVSRSIRDERLPPSPATDAQLQEAARFVISPDGHADDEISTKH